VAQATIIAEGRSVSRAHRFGELSCDRLYRLRVNSPAVARRSLVTKLEPRTRANVRSLPSEGERPYAAALIASHALKVACPGNGRGQGFDHEPENAEQRECSSE
jgi:hypothetical protein